MSLSDYIGGRGEAIAATRLGKICREGDRPYFQLHYLGEKCQTFDFLVELVEADEKTPFFFVQVKTTRKDLTRTQKPPRLRVELSGAEARRMTLYPAPSYLVGVHDIEERAWIISIHGDMCDDIPSITTEHELTPDTLRRLWEEVRDFWQAHEMTRPSSFFLN